MDRRLIAALLVVGAVVMVALSKPGQTVEDRQIGHLKGSTAGVVARAAMAKDIRQTITEASAAPAAPAIAKPTAPELPAIAPAAPAKPAQARALVCSPTWPCVYCDRQRPVVQSLTSRGLTVGNSDSDDFQFVTLTDSEARQRYGVTRWPSIVLLRADGTVARVLVGVQSAARLEAELQQLRR